MLAGDINLNPRPVTTVHNNKIWDGLPFCNCNLSSDWVDMNSILTGWIWIQYWPAGYQFNIDRLNINSILTGWISIQYWPAGYQFNIDRLNINSILTGWISIQYWPAGYQFNIDRLNDNSNSGDKWNMFKNRGMHFIHLNVNSLIPKIEEIRHLAKLTNASVIDTSEITTQQYLLL